MNERGNGRNERRRVMQIGLAALAASVTAGARAQQKIAPALVQYQDHPNGGHQCDQCINFIAPGSCKLVEGSISPKGWCAAFAPKSK